MLIQVGDGWWRTKYNLCKPLTVTLNVQFSCDCLIIPQTQVYIHVLHTTQAPWLLGEGEVMPIHVGDALLRTRNNLGKHLRVALNVPFSCDIMILQMQVNFHIRHTTPASWPLGVWFAKLCLFMLVMVC